MRYRGAPPAQISEGRYGVVYVRGATEEASEYGAAEIQPDGSYAVEGLSDGWYTVEAWFLKRDSGREGTSASKLVEIQGGRSVVFNIDGDVKGGSVEIPLAGLSEALPARFELVSASIPGVVVSSQVEAIRGTNRNAMVEPTTQMNAIASGAYQLRVTNLETGVLLFENPITVYEGRTETIAIKASDLHESAEPDEAPDEE